MYFCNSGDGYGVGMGTILRHATQLWHRALSSLPISDKPHPVCLLFLFIYSHAVWQHIVNCASYFVGRRCTRRSANGTQPNFVKREVNGADAFRIGWRHIVDVNKTIEIRSLVSLGLQNHFRSTMAWTVVNPCSVLYAGE